MASLYEPGSSWMHRLAPVTKLFALAAWCLIALLLDRPASLMGLAAAVTAAGWSAGLLGVVARFKGFLTVLFLMCALLWALYPRGPDAPGWLAGGLRPGVWLGLRLTVMIVMGLFFLASTKVEEMAAGLQSLGVPFRVAFSLTLAFRLLPLVSGAGSTIVQAQACRGADPRRGTLASRVRSYFPLMIPLVLSSLRTADAMAVALESRGFGMSAGRTSIVTPRFRGSDLACVLISAGTAAAVLWLRLAGAV